MSLATDLPSTQIFDKIAQKLGSSDSARQQAINDINGAYAFCLTGEGGGEWFVDAKETGQVGKGVAPEGKSPDVTMTMAAENLQKILDDRNAVTQLFFTGKLKVTGAQMLMMKLDQVFALGR